MNDGEYIPLPPVSGWLEVRVSSALICFDYDRAVTLDYNNIKWFLLKSLDLTLVDNFGRDIDQEDCVMRAWVVRTAKEELKMETKVGTVDTGAHPTARAQFFTATGNVIENFTRAGYTDRIERLMIGTIYSQYAGRKKKLSGTVRLLTDFKVMTDAHENGNYLVTAERQNAIEDESEIVMIEIAPDDFRAVQYTD
jgi:hypothetical protein